MRDRDMCSTKCVTGKREGGIRGNIVYGGRKKVRP